VLLVFDVVVNRTAAIIAAAGVFVFLLGLWAVVPLVERIQPSSDDRHARAGTRRTSGSTSDP
jgi:hypothetical protein